jgi:hypothetical protein
MELIRKYILLLGFLSISLLVSAQNNSILRATSNPASRLIFYDFGMVDFNVNSLYKYQNGMTLSNWNTLAVSFVDTVNVSTWKLQFMAEPAYLQSDGGSANLDLGTIEMVVQDGGGNYNLESNNNIVDPGGDGDFALQNTWTDIITGAPEGSFEDFRIIISYKCGQGSVSLMDKDPDYYFVDIYFRVTPE